MSYEPPRSAVASDEPVAPRDGRNAVSSGFRGDVVEVKNRVQFGPIVAGILTAIATLLILTVLGLAIGSSALEPRDSGQTIGTAAVAGAGSGLINGLMVGAALFAIVLWLTGSGVSSILGTLGSNIGDITTVVQERAGTAVDVEQQAEEVQADVEAQVGQIDPQAAFNTVQDGAWWTLLGLILPLAAAGLGGLVGHNERRDVIQSGS